VATETSDTDPSAASTGTATVNLVASLIVRNELGRYLTPCVEHLLAFCDEIRVADDASTDGTADYLDSLERVHVKRHDTSLFFTHEGRARQSLLEWTLAGKPTHVLAIDADEFVADGHRLRSVVEAAVGGQVWTLIMQEVWKANTDGLLIREDGGWREHPVPIVYAVPQRVSLRQWKIQPRQLACGREPMPVRAMARAALPSGTEVLHFGWANEAQRDARYQRYVAADNGRFHARQHLDSIMWPDGRVTLAQRGWPAGVDRDRLLAAML
jgi:hypothetical protein